MQCARIFLCAMAIVCPLHASACDPDNDVCHGCTAICSYYKDDKKLSTDPHCHQRCQADVYNCIEGTLPQEETDGDRAKCVQETLLNRIREDGDLITKIVYDVPPNFEDLDQLYQEDGRIDSRDMQVAMDILDGGAAPDGTTIPTAKVNVIMEVFREADQDGDGVVTEGEFNYYAKGDDHLGHAVEAMHPSPEQKKIEEAHEELIPEGEQKKSLAQVDVDLMQPAFRSPKSNKRKFQRKKQVQKKTKQTGLAYFQHMLRFGFRVYRAEEKHTHPIGALALKMFKQPKAVSKHQ